MLSRNGALCLLLISIILSGLKRVQVFLRTLHYHAFGLEIPAAEKSRYCFSLIGYTEPRPDVESHMAEANISTSSPRDPQMDSWPTAPHKT
ncbi:hypothetical protein RRG08_051709 [Elysia crispata]|uniref:Secreted protein n=1 Tax=Elysia crispata TaxID=231223 RepID=A0AAE1BBG2_9GAST|nr:hypothetical protein RRG08_051709 [Elysia crispata]